MESNYIRDIEGLKLLSKRLKSAMSVLKRDAASEAKKLIEAKKLAAGYGSFEEAQEAYGWDYITLEQLDEIEKIFKGDDISPTKIALNKLQRIIGGIDGEIKMLNQDDDYRENFKTIKNERGAGRKPFIHIEADDVMYYRSLGWAYRKIADMCNISLGSVQKIITKHKKAEKSA
jgi:hypothetical protein